MKNNIHSTQPLNSTYSKIDLIRLAWSFIITKIFFSKARIIRQPTRIRGYKNIVFGVDFTTGQFCRIEAGNRVDMQPSIIIGDNVQINDRCHIAATYKITISENVLIASNVTIIDHDHGEASLESMLLPPSDRKTLSQEIYIEKNVWIGENVVVLKGVKIGESSIIGAGSIVTSDIPKFSVAVGVPAKVFKTLR